MAYYKTKAPSGMKVTRKGNAVILEWKISDSDYDAGQYVYRNIWTRKTIKQTVKKGKTSVTKYVGKSSAIKSEQYIDPKATSFKTTINPKSYFPYTKVYLTKFEYSLQGLRTTFDEGYYTYYPSWSDKASVTKQVLVPRVPKLTAELSGDNYHITTFSWAENDKNTSFNWFSDFERQTILVADCSENDGSKISWAGAKSITGTIKKQVVVEDTSIFQGNYSYTRWYRVRCRGPRGVSKWKYAKHVYAIPAYSTNVSSSVEAFNKKRGYYRVNVKWKAKASLAHPIDFTNIEYTSTTPETKTSVVTDETGLQYSHTELLPPTMSGGTSVGVAKDTSGEAGIVFSVPVLSEFDQCVLVRVNTQHDENIAYGETTYVSGSFGPLTEPTINSIGTVDPETRRVNIQISNNSQVPNTHLAICYKTESEPDKDYIVGIIPYGKDEVTVILPESCLTEEFSIGAYARCGDYSPLRPDAYEPTYYALTNEIMSSTKTWGEGAVPKAPQRPVLTSPDTGTIRVKWDWSWLDASGAELSWANYKDAWESTEEPSTYIVNNTSVSAWNIRGLDVGMWYVRVRLFKSSGDTMVYGSYSETADIKLLSVPSIPSLALSKSVITEDDQVTCSWAYVTTEESIYTPQQQAEICEAVLQEDGSFVYGNVIARTSTMQYITLVASDYGWKAGETHYLSVQVTSESGETSEDWSTPVALTIANKIDITIRSTSLVEVTEVIEDGDEEVTNKYNVLTKLPLAVDFGFTESYKLSSDPTVVEGKTYYVKQGDDYIAPPEFVVDPSQRQYYEKTVTPLNPNPSSFGYYEVDPQDSLSYILTIDDSWDYSKTYFEKHVEYNPTTDEELDPDKTYYERSGSGTEGDPYIYTEVEDPTVEEIGSYYEQIDVYIAVQPLPSEEISYDLTEDTVWDDTKQYYLRSGEEDAYVYSVVLKPLENPSELGYYESQDMEGEATLIIERAEPYHVDRPDESEFDGFEGETISVINQVSGAVAYFESTDITGLLDDGAKYRLLVSLTDTYGQVAEAEPIEFIVHWDHQAVIPEANIEVFKDDIYTTILPIAPTGYELTQDTTVVEDKKYFIRSGEGTEEDPYIYTEVSEPSGDPHDLGYYQFYDYSEDRCNIYRLSVDSPQLIVEDAEFGTKYVDPYPTLKTFGGYRVSYRTINSDYITEDNRLAWVDYADPVEHQIDRFLTIIDFGKDRVILPYDLELSNKWSKDFTETRYLGGSIQGDWNPAVSRTGSVRTNTVIFEDPDTVKAMRRLAVYPGICHIRTPDGSNYTANINVTEDRENKKIGKLAKFSIDITRVDPEDLDGRTFTSWESENE